MSKDFFDLVFFERVFRIYMFKQTFIVVVIAMSVKIFWQFVPA